MSDAPNMADHLALFKEYEELKTRIRSDEERVKELVPLLLPLVPEDKELQGEKGYFYIQKRPEWTFSSEVKSREADVKKLKEEEKARGVAKVSYAPTLYYKSGRPEDDSGE